MARSVAGGRQPGSSVSWWSTPAHSTTSDFKTELLGVDQVGLNACLSVLDTGDPVRWYSISDLRAGYPPLYPHGILDLL